MRLSTKYLLLMISSAVLLFSCQKDFNSKNNMDDITTLKKSKGKDQADAKFNTFKGPEVEVGNGTVRTFATISHSGVPQEIGVVFTEEALTGLPANNTIYPLAFHHKALETTLFEHVALGWSAGGHGLPPSGKIGPHLDVRFFMMANEERLAIPTPLTSGFPAGGGFDVSSSAGYLPANYVMNAAVAQIGRHWAENIFISGQPVNHTMILGTWNGELTFINPIVTLSTLVSGTSYSIVYPQPHFFAEHGYYPTKYNIYEDDKGRHYVSLSDFVWR